MSGDAIFDLPFFDDSHRALAARLHDFVSREIAPLAADEETGDVHQKTREFVRVLGRGGVLKVLVPETYGGERATVQARDLSLTRDLLAYDSGLADVAFAMQGLGSYPITLAGGEEIKKRVLPQVIAGEAAATFALTEPEAGSDVSAIRSVARRAGEGYRVNGDKRFISNAPVADVLCLFAKTDPDAGTKGLSAFVLEKGASGLSIRPMDLIAPHSIGELHLEDVPVTKANRLGKEGDGFRIAMDTLALFRTTVGAAAIGMARRALDEALSYAKGRVQFGRPIAEFQGLQFYLADMATELDAARLLVYRAAWKIDRGQAAGQESSMAKLYATEVAQRVIDKALQIHGGMGVVKGVMVERLYREIRALRIYEGSSEIQRLILARGLLKGS
jgi:acyl-CoA dehydrogenase